MSGRVHEATVAKSEWIAAKVLRVVLTLPAPIDFRPGQFLSLRVGTDGDGNPILRSYSIASSPGRAEVELIVKIAEGGAASGWFAALKVGDKISATGPMGFFVLDLAHAGDVVFGATGVGIAPVLPMIDEALARSETGRVILHWGNRHASELFWRDQLDERAKNPRFRYTLYLSGPDETEQKRGRIGEGILADLPTLSAPTFYLVGNGAMIRDVKAQLVARGIDRKKQIRNEAFFD